MPVHPGEIPADRALARREPEDRPSERSPHLSCDVAGTGDFEGLSHDWDALARRSNASPFLHPGWIGAWWEAFGRGHLEILTARRRGTLEGVLPIMYRRGTTSSPSNWHTPEFGILSADSSVKAMIVRELFARRRHLVSLGFLTADKQDLEELRTAAQATRYRVLVRVLERSPWVAIQGDWSSYERALSTNLRRDIHRRGRRLAELGRVTLDVSRAATGLSEAFSLERAGWKGRQRTAISSRRDTTGFYTRVAHWAADRGWLRLIFLRLDGRAIAFHLALEKGGAYYPLKGGFDPAFAAYSPGKLIIQATLERAFDVGLQRYEFLGGDDSYKRAWAADAHDRFLFQAFASTPIGLVHWTAYTGARPLVKRALGIVRRPAD